MKRILLTGMSGTGKSTVVDELARRGYKAVDLDNDAFSEWVPFSAEPGATDSAVEADRDWVWREDRVHALLATEDADLLFVSGCAANMGKFLPQFDQVILLSAPAGVIVKRLAARTNNAYGKRPEEAARVLGLIDTIEPLLRKVAGHEIDTSAGLDAVVEHVLRCARTSP